MNSKFVDIPEFHSRQEVIKWTNQLKYSEPVRRAIKNRMQWFLDLSYLGSDPTLYQIDMAHHYAMQNEYLEWALAIIENMKQHGMKSDEAMVTIPSAFTSKDDAVWWAQGQHENLFEIQEAILRKMIVVTKEYWLNHGSFRAGLAEAQMERLEAALKVIQDKLHRVGAEIFIGEIPLR